jgi:hypothetical protein
MVSNMYSLIGAVLYWIRGRGWPWGTTINRLIWAIPTGTFIWSMTLPPLYILPLCIIASFVAMIATGHGAHLGVGRNLNGDKTETATFWLPWIINRETNQKLYDFVGLTVIALFRDIIMMLPVVYWNTETLIWLFFSPLHAFSYCTGWFLYEKIKWKDPLYYSEFIWGGIIWFYIGVLNGN